MKTANLVIIDDKDHAILQIRESLKNISIDENRDGIRLIHFDSFQEYRENNHSLPLIVFLDFFLDNDSKAGIHFLPEIKTKYLVGFSSKEVFSNLIREKALEFGFQNDKVFAVHKLKSQLENRELEKVLKEIFTKENILWD